MLLTTVYQEKRWKEYARKVVLELYGFFQEKSRIRLSKRTEEQEAEIRRRVLLELQIRIPELQRTAEETAKKEADTLLEEFDGELQELRRSLECKSEENRRLHEKLKQINKDSVAKESVILSVASEKDLYEGEVKDIVLQVLSDSLKFLPADSRKADVIKDVVSGNGFQHLGSKKEEKLKNVLKSYNGMNKQVQKQLENLGLFLEYGQKHYKITYYGDSRYKAALGKTPSDFRAGRNTASILANRFF